MQFNYSKYFYIFLFHIIDTYTNSLSKKLENCLHLHKKYDRIHIVKKTHKGSKPKECLKNKVFGNYEPYGRNNKKGGIKNGSSCNETIT